MAAIEKRRMYLILLINIGNTFIIFKGVSAYKHLGCYPSTVQSHDATRSNANMTVDTGVEECRDRGYPFAGLQGAKSYCSDIYNISATRGLDSECGTKCPGSGPGSNATCGGTTHIDLYYTVTGAPIDTDNDGVNLRPTDLNWERARRECVKQDNDLLVFTGSNTTQIETALNTTLGLLDSVGFPDEEVWIGIYQHGDIFHSTNEYQTYIHSAYVNTWDTGNNTMDYKCVIVDGYHRSLKTESCGLSNWFMCAKPLDPDTLTPPPTPAPYIPWQQQIYLFFQDSNNVVMCLVLPLLGCCYGGSCLIYLFAKLCKACRQRKRRALFVENQTTEPTVGTGYTKINTDFYNGATMDACDNKSLLANDSMLHIEDGYVAKEYNDDDQAPHDSLEGSTTSTTALLEKESMSRKSAKDNEIDEGLQEVPGAITPREDNVVATENETIIDNDKASKTKKKKVGKGKKAKAAASAVSKLSKRSKAGSRAKSNTSMAIEEDGGEASTPTKEKKKKKDKDETSDKDESKITKKKKKGQESKVAADSPTEAAIKKSKRKLKAAAAAAIAVTATETEKSEKNFEELEEEKKTPKKGKKKAKRSDLSAKASDKKSQSVRSTDSGFEEPTEAQSKKEKPKEIREESRDDLREADDIIQDLDKDFQPKKRKQSADIVHIPGPPKAGRRQDRGGSANAYVPSMMERSYSSGNDFSDIRRPRTPVTMSDILAANAGARGEGTGQAWGDGGGEPVNLTDVPIREILRLKAMVKEASGEQSAPRRPKRRVIAS
ncbi:unnamed protein product [Owenia fusiformis]|uniref:Uncharacterized protein n=1 Tax=Owenia fusiformis TaxID=6347 RepID=A0A8J1UZB9_OWEFU|nr:unnamed protein product [Owenia fusiformis]